MTSVPSVAAPPAVVVDDLTVRYGHSVVLDHVSAEIERGRWTALIGRNGAGKSTLIAAVVGFGPGADRVRFDPPGSRRSRLVAYVPQSPDLPAGMTVSEYVLLGRTAHLGWFESERPADRGAAAAAIERLHLEPLADREMRQLSGGEAQRAVLARALCQDAPILVMDEPTSSLDIGHQVEVLSLVASLAREHDLTVISALHDLTAAHFYADRVLVLDGGRLVADGPPDDVMTADRLSRCFRTPILRSDDHEGRTVIVPLHSLSEEFSP